jgi:hypothetical protein
MCGGVDVLLHSSLSWELDVGDRSVYAPAVLPSYKAPQLPVEYDAGWSPETVWTFWRREIALILSVNRTRARQALDPLSTDLAIPTYCIM